MRLHDCIDVRVVCKGDDFLSRPSLVYVPFDADPKASGLELEALADGVLPARAALASSMLDRGLAPKTVRNVMTFLHSIFEHAIAGSILSPR